MTRELPASENLLPGSSSFKNHPGFDARDCELSEIVVAVTHASNNGFRCHMTGGHCLPGPYCDDRRAAYAKLKEEQAMEDDMSIIVYEFHAGYRLEAIRMFGWLRHYGFTPSYVKSEDDSQETAIAIPQRELKALQLLKASDPSRWGK